VGVRGARPIYAQEPQVQITPQKAPSIGGADRMMPSISVNSNLVLIPVMVTDRNDQMVAGLDREQFKLYDDKVEQVITHFASEDVPVSVSLVFDTSGSMGPKLTKSRAAVTEFIRTANPQDEFNLIQFNDRVHLMAPFTNEGDEILSRLTYLEAHGRTALLDAICLALDELKTKARHQRKAILIISDGGDNSSRYSAREVKRRVREADVQVYSIGIVEPLIGRIRSIEELSGPALLDSIAHDSGGRLFEVSDLNGLSDIAAKIGAALRNQYVLGYSPSADMRDGKYHRVQVKVARPSGVPKLRTTFRTGYIAPVN
jgi:VWFA-related protein